MGSLIATVFVLGLGVAVTSPVSVVTMIVLLGLPRGRLRGFAFVAGWLLAIAVVTLLTALALHRGDFSSTQTSPSRAASALEVAIGCLLLGWGAIKYRRRGQRLQEASTPKWLDRLARTNWLLAIIVGAFMLTWSITVAAAAEILKANVSTADDALAFALFALGSLVTITAPLIYALVRPERSEEVLARWKEWLIRNSGTVVLVVLMVVGAALIVRGAIDLAR
jgi:threonine/homoserine/homoserine lactone efflux protein